MWFWFKQPLEWLVWTHVCMGVLDMVCVRGGTDLTVTKMGFVIFQSKRISGIGDDPFIMFYPFTPLWEVHCHGSGHLGKWFKWVILSSIIIICISFCPSSFCQRRLFVLNVKELIFILPVQLELEAAGVYSLSSPLWEDHSPTWQHKTSPAVCTSTISTLKHMKQTRLSFVVFPNVSR